MKWPTALVDLHPTRQGISHRDHRGLIFCGPQGTYVFSLEMDRFYTRLEYERYSLLHLLGPSFDDNNWFVVDLPAQATVILEILAIHKS